MNELKSLEEANVHLLNGILTEMKSIAKSLEQLNGNTTKNNGSKDFFKEINKALQRKTDLSFLRIEETNKSLTLKDKDTKNNVTWLFHTDKFVVHDGSLSDEDIKLLTDRKITVIEAPKNFSSFEVKEVK